MTKVRIKIAVSAQDKIKNLKRWSRAASGRPRSSKKITPKKGGPYRRRAKHRHSLLSNE